MKMIAVAPHHWYVQPLVAPYITFGVGYCFIHSKGNAKTRVWDKANIVPTPYFFIRFHLGIGGKKCNIMSANYIFDADFAAYLIKKLKEMRKSNGAPFIRHGVTLPYLAYTYKCLNCDSSAITEDYLWNIITSLEKAGSTLFIYQYCSDIEEFVIALFSKQYDDTIKEQGFYTRDSESTILYDSHFFEITPSSKELYERYKDILLKNTFSRVYKEYKYDWGTVSKEDIDAISTIIEEYKSKQCL